MQIDYLAFMFVWHLVCLLSCSEVQRAMKVARDLEFQFVISGPWAISQSRVTRSLMPINVGLLNLGSLSTLHINISLHLTFRKAVISIFKAQKEQIAHFVLGDGRILFLQLVFIHIRHQNEYCFIVNFETTKEHIQGKKFRILLLGNSLTTEVAL